MGRARTTPAAGSRPPSLGRAAARLLAPEDERAADRRRERRDRRLVQARVLPGPGHGVLRLPFRELLANLPHAPSEHGVPPVHDPHGRLLSSVARVSKAEAAKPHRKEMRRCEPGLRRRGDASGQKPARSYLPLPCPLPVAWPCLLLLGGGPAS